MSEHKKNPQHSKLAGSMKNLVTFYNRLLDNYESEFSKMSYQSKLIYKNSLNFISDKIAETKNKIKNSQREYQTVVIDPKLKAQKPVSSVLSKELFISFMDIIKKYMERDDATCDDLNNIIKKRYPEMDACGFGYDISPNTELYHELVEWIAKAIGDNSVGCALGDWISYYVYETDWGHAFGSNKVTDNGENIPFNTLSEVYDAVQRFSQKK